MYEQGINGINFVDSIISGTCSKNKYYESIVTDVCNQHRTVRERHTQEKKNILNRVLAY